MKTLIVHLFLLLSIHAFTQTKDLPIEALKGNDPAKPLLLYISGDGGWNKFSTSLVNTLNKQDYPVQAIKTKNTQIIRLAGGHHYDGNVDELVRKIVDSIK